MGCVYLAWNTPGRKGYVGKTKKSIEERKEEHYKCAIDGSSYFHRAIRKYGEGAFRWVVLEEDDDDEFLFFMECRWIKMLGTRCPDGYNMTDGGDGFRGSHSEETRRKMSVSQTGKVISEETRKRMSDAQKGRVFSPEWRASISRAKAGVCQSAESNAKRSQTQKGRTYDQIYGPERAELMRAKRRSENLSDETKEKMRLAQLGKKMSPESIAKTVAAHLGKKRSDETRRRISEAKKKRKGNGRQTDVTHAPELVVGKVVEL